MLALAATNWCRDAIRLVPALRTELSLIKAELSRSKHDEAAARFARNLLRAVVSRLVERRRAACERARARQPAPRRALRRAEDGRAARIDAGGALAEVGEGG